MLNKLLLMSTYIIRFYGEIKKYPRIITRYTLLQTYFSLETPKSVIGKQCRLSRMWHLIRISIVCDVNFFAVGISTSHSLTYLKLKWGWSGGAKVLCILHHRGVQLILAYSWARPAILVVGKGRGGMFLFLLFLHFHSCSSFFPVPLFHLLYSLFYLFSPFL